MGFLLAPTRNLGASHKFKKRTRRPSNPIDLCNLNPAPQLGVLDYKARAMGFEPTISSVTGRRLKPGWTTPAYCRPCAEGGSRTHDLHVMSVALLPTELPRRILAVLKMVAPPRIARGPAAYETAEVLLLQGAMLR